MKAILKTLVGGRDTVGLRLALLAAVCVAPVALFALLATAEAYAQKRAVIEQHMGETAQAMVLAFDSALGDVRAALQALATSPHLEAGDFAGFHAQARKVTKLFPDADIIMADHTGQQLVNTYRAWGEKLPRRNAPDLVRQVFENGKPVVGDVFLGALTGRALVAHDVPVVLDGKVTFDLSMTIPAERLGASLDRLKLPPRWAGLMLDRNRKVAGQVGDAPPLVGRMAPDGLRVVADAGESTVFRTVGADNQPVVVAAAVSPDTGWTALVIAPAELVDGELRKWLLLTAGGAAALLALGVGLALRAAAGIAHAIRRLIDPALALGRGERVAVALSGLKETDAVAGALNDASRLMAERAAQRDRAQEELLERTSQVERQLDGLRALNDVAASAETNAQKLLSDALSAGLAHLGMEIGIVSKVEGRKYIVLRHAAPEDAPLDDGAVFDVGETYCALTLDADSVTAISHMRASSYAGHPCYEKFRLEAYIGAPLTVRGRRYGTVNFTARNPAPRPFDHADREFVGLLARWVGAVLERGEVLNELGRINAELEQFAYIASHDLREPLRRVSAYATLLERRLDGGLDEEAKGYLAVVRDGAKRMNRLILDMLDYAAIGRHDRRPAAVDLARVAAEVCAKLAARIEAAGATVTGGETLPTVGGDHIELTQLFRYLIDNAIKHHGGDRDAGRAPRIALSAARRADGWWTACVADDGIGVAAEHHHRIFLIFQRLRAHADNDAGQEGAGIGLAGAKKIVERLGGRIWLESVPGDGCRFYFTLPPAPGGDETSTP